MKKLVIAGALASALILSACGASTGGYSPSDWDLNNPSAYNNQTYCHNGTYNPLPNNQFTCTINGTTSQPSKRPTVIIPPKSQQKSSGSSNSGYKSSTGSGYKSGSSGSSYKAPSFKAPSFKSGK